LAFQFKATECAVTTPLPVRERLAGALDELLESDTIPLAFPVPDGLKLTDRVTYWPGGTVTPAPIPLAVKLEPGTEFICKARGLSPLLERVTSKVRVLPTATSPKSALELAIVKTGGPRAGLAKPPPPPQPAAARTTDRRAKWNLLFLFFISNS